MICMNRDNWYQMHLYLEVTHSLEREYPNKCMRTSKKCAIYAVKKYETDNIWIRRARLFFVCSFFSFSYVNKLLCWACSPLSNCARKQLHPMTSLTFLSKALTICSSSNSCIEKVQFIEYLCWVHVHLQKSCIFYWIVQRRFSVNYKNQIFASFFQKKKSFQK